MLEHDAVQDELRTHKAVSADATDRGNAAARDAERWQDECTQLSKEVAALQKKCAFAMCCATSVLFAAGKGPLHKHKNGRCCRAPRHNRFLCNRQ